MGVSLHLHLQPRQITNLRKTSFLSKCILSNSHWRTNHKKDRNVENSLRIVQTNTNCCYFDDDYCLGCWHFLCDWFHVLLDEELVLPGEFVADEYDCLPIWGFELYRFGADLQLESMVKLRSLLGSTNSIDFGLRRYHAPKPDIGGLLWYSYHRVLSSLSVLSQCCMVDNNIIIRYLFIIINLGRDSIFKNKSLKLFQKNYKLNNEITVKL